MLPSGFRDLGMNPTPVLGNSVALEFLTLSVAPCLVILTS